MKVRGSRRHTSQAWILAAALALLPSPTLLADDIECVYDGYIAMGGMVVNTTNSYLLPGNPDWQPTGGMETFCYAFLKFDREALPTTPVSSAVLQLEVICLQDGMSYPVTTEGAIGTVGAYAVSGDVESISYSTCDAFRDYIADTPESTNEIEAPGGDGFFASGTLITLDVKNIVNEWISSGNNYGLVLACTQGYMLRLHSDDSTAGAHPLIVTGGAGDIPGDLNGDSVVGMGDLPHFLDALLGIPPTEPEIRPELGDMNDDELVNGSDIQLFMNAVLHE